MSRRILSAAITTFLAGVALVAVMFLALRAGLVPVGSSSVVPTPTAMPLNAFLATTPTPVAGARVTPVPTTLPTPSGPRPPMSDAVAAYVKAWQEARYADMHGMLTSGASARMPKDQFVSRHGAIMAGATVNKIDLTYPPVREPPENATRSDAQLAIVYHTGRFGELKEQTSMPMAFENGQWRVEWSPGMLFKDLTHERKVEVFYEDPIRGNIVDRNGVPLAEQAQLPMIGVIPGNLTDRPKAVAELAQALQLKPEIINRKLDAAKPDWWVPLGVSPPDQRADLTKRFGTVPGVLVEERPGRLYPHGPVAPHIIGYVSPILEDDLKTLAAKGYGPEDVVGRTGVELTMESELAGSRGGRLYIVEPSGETVRVIAERPSRNGANIQLTLDIEIQKKTEAILGDKIGSIVLLDPRDNGVVAMATNPRFDPNGFVFGMSGEQWQALQNDPNRPFQHRPAMSAYATGSIFKVITMAAGLERGGFRPNSGFNCGGSWSLPNSRIVFGDWVKTGHGQLDLMQGLVESCDIVFYELGKKLENTDSRILPDYSRQFGLGEPTGINGISEIAGTLPSPEWKEKQNDHWYPGDAINLAIGQGYLEATPLQMANVYSVLANGGTLRKPLLVRKIGPPSGTEQVKELKSEDRRKVQVSNTSLAAIHEAMKRTATTARGTALYAFNGYRIPVAAKTGSAENQHAQAHAWFGGYGPADDPQLVVVVMVEGGEMGGVVAAPRGRQAFEAVLGTG